MGRPLGVKSKSVITPATIISCSSASAPARVRFEAPHSFIGRYIAASADRARHTPRTTLWFLAQRAPTRIALRVGEPVAGERVFVTTQIHGAYFRPLRGDVDQSSDRVCNVAMLISRVIDRVTRTTRGASLERCDLVHGARVVESAGSMMRQARLRQFAKRG